MLSDRMHRYLWQTKVGCLIGLLNLIVGSLSSSALAQDLMRFDRLPTSPSDRELSNVGASSEGAQGIATSRRAVFYSNSDTVFKMDTSMQSTTARLNFSNLRFGGAQCSHVGGIDVYSGRVYVALDKCSDRAARVVVLSTELSRLGFASLPALEGSFPWVSVNPLDPDFFYTVSKDGRLLLAFERSFASGDSLAVSKSIDFRDHPADVPALNDFWTQGGDFAPNGIFLRVVDDARDEDSHHTGVWVYEMPHPIVDGSSAARVGFINIRYDPDIVGNRADELEDLDADSTISGPFQSALHVLFLSNELGEDDISVLHFASRDLDRDGSSDLRDNCWRVANPEQIDLDFNQVGFECDHAEVGRIVVPLISIIH